MPYETLLVDRDGPTAIITITRPKSLNALNAKVFEELLAAFDELEAEPAIRCVIITGAGDRAFVAGADIGELAALKDTTSATQKARAGHRIT